MLDFPTQKFSRSEQAMEAYAQAKSQKRPILRNKKELQVPNRHLTEKVVPYFMGPYEKPKSS